MKKNEWLELACRGGGPPESADRKCLMQELFSYLGDRDPTWRDSIAFTILARWISKGALSNDEVRYLISKSLDSIYLRTIPSETDSVFRRSFSILILAAAVEHDNVCPNLSSREVRRILERSLTYLDMESDLRGYVPTKGWAHAMAHSADLLDALSKNEHLDDMDVQHILQAISRKLVRPTPYALLYGEPDRLAQAVVTLLDYRDVPMSFLSRWIAMMSFTHDHQCWRDIDAHPEMVNARANTMSFLSCLTARLLLYQKGKKIVLSSLVRKLLKAQMELSD